jgi:hypothetical protein
MVALPPETSVVLLSGEELLSRQLSDPCDPPRGSNFETSPSGRIKTYFAILSCYQSGTPPEMLYRRFDHKNIAVTNSVTA